MQAYHVVQKILTGKQRVIQNGYATAFAPVNIALCKYWGKKSRELNIPDSISLSIALPDKGTMTTVRLNKKTQHQVWLNGYYINPTDKFFIRLTDFLHLFRPQISEFLDIEIVVNIPIGSGLASSACGFAALVLALNRFLNWKLTQKELSILARLGSGSACRSLWHGFVQWEVGKNPDGMDSFAKPLHVEWPQLCLGILSLTNEEKSVSSREAMELSKHTSPFYPTWLKQCDLNLISIRKAIKTKDFHLLGTASENNALAMHATAMTSQPAIVFANSVTLKAIQKIWQARNEGLELFFTQDAGANLILIFLQKDNEKVKNLFPHVDIITPFADPKLENSVILVEEQDIAYGHLGKEAAHQQGLCHRAISVFIFRYKNGQLETLLQQRSLKKYHSGGLWTNACCSHPRAGENIFNAAHRRLKEEMGLSCELIPKGVFHYNAALDNELTENEIDHVFTGFYDKDLIKIDPNEVETYKWISMSGLEKDLIAREKKYTTWFKAALRIALSDHYQNELE
jgi:diphosphomevalonate decarboxylase